MAIEQGAGASISRPYFDDPYTTQFASRVSARRDDDAGHWVSLESSYFYPESGGQEADRGTLSGVAVLDVQKDEQGTVWHRLAGPVPDEIEGCIDPERRASNRRQHTGQHILSRAFIELLGADTIASRLGEDVGTIDLERDDLTWDEVDRVELAANRVVWENRPVRSHRIEVDELGRFALRKPPGVIGLVRVIEIENWDNSACGGTHCHATGEVGAIKVRRWEKMKGGLHLEFVCGDRALRDYQARVRSLVEAARRRDTGDGEILEQLERAAEERDRLRRELKRAREALAVHEAHQLAEAHAARGGAVLLEIFDQRDADSMRAVLSALTAEGVPRVVLATRAPEPRVAAARPRGKEGENLREFLPLLLETARGNGGGGPDQLQAAAVDADAAEAAARAVAAAWAERE